MRKQMALTCLFAIVAFTASIANKVTIQGIVKNPNGTPAVGAVVWFAADPGLTDGCRAKDSARTSPNGAFAGSLECNTNIRKVMVATMGCNGQVLQKIMEVPANNTVVAEFVTCAPTECHPAFRWELADNTGKAFNFNSTASMAGSGDEIIRRVWTFGDGTANEGNNATIKKTYSAPGTYEVCLKILTRNGCTKSLCQKITVGTIPAVCKAAFVFERIPANAAGAFSYRFNSASVMVQDGDEVVSRTWHFGDGGTLSGNTFSPTHTYQKAGTYEVCLTIKTKKGCENRTCGLVVVAGINCTPELLYEVVPTSTTSMDVAVGFNSKYQVNAMPDSIVSRTWIFGDGQTLTGNVPNPLHTYKQAGSYKVCLVTKTHSGCISEVCRTIQVERSGPACIADFKMERGPEHTGYFSATPSKLGPNDAIAKTIWHFGDGSSQTVNASETKHQYNKPGLYEVCLTVVSRNGCESKLCKKVEIGPINTSDGCNARFTIDQSRPGLVIFNSESAVTRIPDDKIIYRRWDFGNGKIIDGNRVITEMQYPFGGRFNVCLTIKTAKGCESRICQTIEVKQGQAPVDSSRLWLVKYFPNPVQHQLFAVVYSPKANEEVELAIVDVYGIVKSIMKVKVPMGYSTHVINTGSLLPGPYLLRCRSAYGVQSRNFYKVY